MVKVSLNIPDCHIPYHDEKAYEVMLLIAKVEKKFISISTWEVEDEEYRNDNIEVVNIIRSTIVESKRIP